MKLTRIAAGIAACCIFSSAQAAGPFTFAHEWTFTHTANALSQAQGSEILSFDAVNRQLWIVGTDANVGSPVGRSGIDVLNLDGSFVTSLDLQSIGGVNSVAIANGKAAVAITAPSENRCRLRAFLRHHQPQPARERDGRCESRFGHLHAGRQQAAGGE